jgi:RNA polymerase sigma factor (TIGR02999 family)
MSGESSGIQLTRVLKDWSDGDPSALERLTPFVYAELHRLAQRKLARLSHRDVLQPSALVNEAFVRLLASEPVDWASRTHFFAHSAVIMRRVLIDFTRAQKTAKRARPEAQTSISGLWDAASEPAPVDLLDLDRALGELGEIDPRLARVVELRYFGGLENAEVAVVLGISEPTVIRDWRKARTWLFSRLQPAGAAS